MQHAKKEKKNSLQKEKRAKIKSCGEACVQKKDVIYCEGYFRNVLSSLLWMKTEDQQQEVRVQQLNPHTS